MTDSTATGCRRFAQWIVFAAVALLTAACSRDLPVPELVKQARELHSKGELQAALIQLKNALLKEPNHPEARFLLGLVYNDAGDVRSAEKELRLAKKLGLIEAGHVDAALGRALVEDGKYQAVLDEINPFPAFDAEGTAGVLAARGHAYLWLGKIAEAKQAYEEAQRAKADYPDALLGLARMALLEQKRDAGLALIEQILKLSPRHFDTWMLKGDVLRYENKLDEATSTYGSAVKIRPASVIARISRANVYLSSGKVAEAQADVDAAAKILPRHLLVNYTRALILFRQSKFREALAAVQQALQVAPKHAPSLLLIGAVNYSLRSYNQAEGQLSAFVRDYPANLTARKLLSATLIELKRGKEAAAVIEPLVGNNVQDWVVLALAGSASMGAGDADKATEMMEKAVGADPKNAQLRSRLGMSYLAKGDTARAIGELEEAVQLDSTVGRSNAVLVITYLRNREYDKAMEALARFEAKNPKAPVIHQLRGMVFAAKGDVAAARKSYQMALSMQPKYFPAAASLAASYLRENNSAAARQVYEDLLAKDKDNLPALMALAKLRALSNDHPAAVELLERARRAHPNAVLPRIQLGTYFLQTGQAQKAASVAVEAEKVAPQDPAVLELVGSAQLATGEASSAALTFTTLSRLRPDSVVAQSGLGFASMRLKQYKQAVDYFRQALRLKPRDYELTVALTEALRSDKNYDQAIQSARELARLRPSAPAGRMLEGDVLYEQARYGEARRLYESALELGKTGELVLRAYQAQARAGDSKGAVARLEQWVRENPTDALPRSTLGEAMLSAGNYKAAAEHFQVLVERSGQNAFYLNNLAVAFDQLKDPRALEMAERALKVAPANPLVLDTYGWILVSRDRAKEAIPYLDQAIAQLPGIPEVRYHLGAALAKAGEQGRAKRELERALAAGKPFPGINEAKSLLARL